MIRYALRCDHGHCFESWFQSAAAYDRQHKRKLVECPSCGSAKVEKSIMAPQITRRGRTKDETPATTTAERPAPATLPAPASLMMAQERELRAKLRELRAHVTKNADNVGTRFPEEARKMHYGEIDHRPIYGEASSDEARAMIEEGLEVSPLPVLPDDRN